MFSVFAFIFVASVSVLFTAAAPGLLVLSFGGFHPDSMNQQNTPHIYNELLPIGAGPPFMHSVFPPKTFVTHFSLATGVFPENHGVYDDQLFNDDSVMPYGQSTFKHNSELVPIWTENQKKGNARYSGVMTWPGGEFTYNDTPITHNVPYTTKMDWEERATTIVKWMTTAVDKANFVMAYFEGATPCYNKNDRAAHLENHFKKIDDTIFKIYTDLKTPITEGTIDMIILSDFGTQEVTYDKILPIENYVDPHKAYLIVSGPIVYIKPVAGNNDVLKKVLEHDDSDLKYTVHKDKFEDLQKMKTNLLDGVIILLAKKGHTFIRRNDLDNIVSSVGDKDNVVLDQNGYDIYNTKMNGFFLGIGKKFKDKIFPVGPFSLIDVYPLLKLLLELPSEASDQQRNLALNSVVNELLEAGVSDAYRAQHNS